MDIKKDITSIKNNLMKQNDEIDKKCLEIYNQNDENEDKIIKYKFFMENIILEHHKICKLMFK